MSILRIFLCCVAVTGSLMAQAESHVVLRGELHSVNLDVGNDYVAELYSTSSHTVAASAFIANSGDFEFRNISAGPYTLRIATIYGRTVTTVSVDAGSNKGPIEVLLPTEKQSKPVSGTVSVGELQHQVPKKALQAAAAAQRLSESGEFEAAMKELRKAVRIDPAYVDARGNLGVQYARTGRYQEAVAEFEEGLRLQPASSLMNSNLASVLLAMRQTDEAEKVARRALSLDRRNIRANYILGRALLTRVESRPEALRNLLLAEAEIPNARLAAAQLYAWAGDNRSAIAELRKYLATNNSPNRNAIESTIRSLENGSEISSSLK